MIVKNYSTSTSQANATLFTRTSTAMGEADAEFEEVAS